MLEEHGLGGVMRWCVVSVSVRVYVVVVVYGVG